MNTGGADLRGDAMRHYSVVVDAYLTARAKTESVTGVHNDSLIGAMSHTRSCEAQDLHTVAYMVTDLSGSTVEPPLPNTVEYPMTATVE